MFRKRSFFKANQDQIARWVERRKGGDWSERKVVQEIECGGGKSSLVPLWAYTLKQMGLIDKVCWAVPRLALAEQGVEIFKPEKDWNWSQFGVAPSEAANYQIRFNQEGNEINPSKGMFGYVVSYQAIGLGLNLHISEFKRYRYLLVLDEPQFAKVEKVTGERIEQLAQHAAFTLVLSGDFDTSDNERVAMVDYVSSKDKGDFSQYVRTDYQYTYLDALTDNAVLPIDFNYADGAVSYFDVKTDDLFEWRSLREVDEPQVMQALRALLKTQYAFELLDACTSDWMKFRKEGIDRDGKHYPAFESAQLLIVAGNINEAQKMFDHLCDPLGKWNFNQSEVVLVTSKDADPTGKLSAFRGNRPYNGGGLPVRIAITVAMAYVGMDAPDVSHLCVLTFYRSSPWIHQLLARAWRLYDRKHGIPYEKQYCVAFVPPDKKLDEIIMRIRDSIRVGWHEPMDRTSCGGGEFVPDVTIVEYGKLVEQWRQYALDPESVRQEKSYLGNTLVDLERIRQTLVDQQLPDRAIAAAMAAIELEMTNTPKTRSKHDQYLIDRKQLEDYQVETVNMLMRLFGWSYPSDKKKWQAIKTFVSGKMKDAFEGAKVEELDADAVTYALNNEAPHLRQWCIDNRRAVWEKVQYIESKGWRHAA